jgi:hypothetical protein
MARTVTSGRKMATNTSAKPTAMTATKLKDNRCNNGGARIGAGRIATNPSARRANERVKDARAKVLAEKVALMLAKPAGEYGKNLTPLQYLLAVMNDPFALPVRRD